MIYKKVLAALLVLGVLVVGGCSGEQPKVGDKQSPQGQTQKENSQKDISQKGNNQNGNPQEEELKDRLLAKIDLKEAGVNLLDYNQDMKVSPQGNMIILSGRSTRPEESRIESALTLVDLQKGKAEILAKGMYVTPLAWSPDGREVLYVQDDALQMMDITSKEQRKIAEASYYGAFSPDGSKIAYTQRNKGLFVVNTDGTGVKQLTKTKEDWYPVWFPDGQKLFYFADLGKTLSDGAGQLQGPAIISVEGGKRQLLIKGEQGKYRKARWIVPGQVLNVVKGWDDGYYEYIMDIKHNKSYSIAEFNTMFAFGYATAVDEQAKVLLSPNKGKVEIYDTQGKIINHYQLAGQEENNFNYSYSPDGRKVAYLYGDMGNSVYSKIKGRKVWVGDADGKNPQALTDYGDYYTPVWTPDGKEIIYLQIQVKEGQGIFLTVHTQRIGDN